jgi:hypothetical protein
MNWPSLITALAFGLAAMAPIVGIVLVGLAGSPRWRAWAALAAPAALVVGVACAALWFAGLRIPTPASLSSGVAALIVFGAGFSAGGLLTLLGCAVRSRFSAPAAASAPRKDAPPSS